MIKYNIQISSLIDTDLYDLDNMIIEYDCRIINFEKKEKFILYNFIISESNILLFLYNLSNEFRIRYIFDDIIHQINLIYKKQDKKDIYCNFKYNKKAYYKEKLSKLDNEIFFVCKKMERY